MKYLHPSEAQLSDFALHALQISEHLKTCDACRASMFVLPAVRASAHVFDPDPGWVITIDDEEKRVEDSDLAAPLIAAAWRAQKSIQCRIDAEEPTVDWSAMLGLAARVNRLLEAEGWQGEWWVPPHL